MSTNEVNIKKFDTLYTNKKFVKNSSKEPIYVKVNKYEGCIDKYSDQTKFDYYENYR